MKVKQLKVTRGANGYVFKDEVSKTFPLNEVKGQVDNEAAVIWRAASKMFEQVSAQEKL